jgi:hypothetical protein
MNAKRQSGPRKWGNLLVTRETFEFLRSLGRKRCRAPKTPRYQAPAIT